jgi:PTH1 family peptidyl-tRNA hydrolase
VKLVVGLGNPGARYQGTRHNTGFQVVELMAGRLGVTIRRVEAQSLTGRAMWAGETLILAKPQTFMNSSGEAVRALIDYYRIAPYNLLLVYDDLDLPPGRLRMRAKGSAGGHKGMRSIIEYLRTDAFARLRVGIGAVPLGMDGADYVLSPFDLPEEALLMGKACLAAVDASLWWVELGIEKAMARVNARGNGDNVP